MLSSWFNIHDFLTGPQSNNQMEELSPRGPGPDDSTWVVVDSQSSESRDQDEEHSKSTGLIEYVDPKENQTTKCTTIRHTGQLMMSHEGQQALDEALYGTERAEKNGKRRRGKNKKKCRR